MPTSVKWEKKYYLTQKISVRTKLLPVACPVHSKSLASVTY